MKKLLLSLLVVIVAASVQAKSWKIGPSSVTGMDFASINAAMSSSNVSEGDTLYLNHYYSTSATQTITKRVVVIGTGYDKSQIDENVVATLTGTLELKANNVQVKSVKLATVYFYNEDCILDRCYATYIYYNSIYAGINHVYSCYIEGRISGNDSSNKSMIDLQNCVVKATYESTSGGYSYNLIQYFYNSIFNNNILYFAHSNSSSTNTSYYTLNSITNSQITNNYIYDYWYYYYTTSKMGYENTLSSNTVSIGSGNTIEHNVLTGSYYSLSNYPTNRYGTTYATLSNVFTCSGSYSNYYQLTEKSACRGYATDGGDVGCHGGMFGNPAGGRPQYIPYFTKVTVGSRSEDGKLPVSISVKIQEE